MLGGVQTLMTRSLRVDMRSARTHIIRLMCLVPVYFFLWYAQSMSFMFGAPGLQFFTVMATLNCMFIMFAGVSYFATPITEEKEQLTLGLLRMAGVSPISILLGKSMPRLINSALLLTAQFPFTLLAITLGGVTMHQVTAAYVSLLAYLLATANLGLLLSVLSPRSNSASTRMSVLTAIYLFGPSLCENVLKALVTWGVVAETSWLASNATKLLEWVNETSGWNALRMVTATGFSGTVFTTQVISNVVAGLLFFGVAWALFDRFNAEEVPAGPGRSIWWTRIRLNKQPHCSRTWNHALIWKDFYFFTGGKAGLVWKFLLYGAIAALFIILSNINNTRALRRDDVGGLLMWLSCLALAIELSISASRVFRDEIKWQTYSGLAMLPISIARMAYSKLAGCLLGLLPGLFYLAVGTAIYPVDDTISLLTDVFTEPEGWYLLTLFAFFLHLIVMLSLYLPWGALPLAFVTTFVGGYILIFMTQIILAQLMSMSPGTRDFIFGLVTAAIAAAVAALHISIGLRLKQLVGK